MADSSYTMNEIRFDVRDEQVTHCYVLCDAEGDSPIGVQGWHYKAFPARIPVAEILLKYLGDVVLWPLKAPPGR